MCLQYKFFLKTLRKKKKLLLIWVTLSNFHQIYYCRLQTLSVWKSLKPDIGDRVNFSFSHTVSKVFFPTGSSKFINYWSTISSYPNDKILDWSTLKAFADSQIIVSEKLKFVLGRVENIVGKGEKCWFLSFSPFSTMFTKRLLFQAC